jgi:alkylhydroperoxidase family enzyme
MFLQLQGSDPQVTAALRKGDLASAPVTPPERALLELVELLTKHAYRCQDEDVAKLRSAGWTDPQIAEAVYITAMFAFFNRVADAFGLEDPHYELLAQPPQPQSWPQRIEDQAPHDRGS